MSSVREFLTALVEIMRGISNSIAIQNRALIEFMEDQKTYRLTREQKENLDTEQKIEKVLESRFNWGVWFRDRVLPGIIQLIIIGLLYLVFNKP